MSKKTTIIITIINLILIGVTFKFIQSKNSTVYILVFIGYTVFSMILSGALTFYKTNNGKEKKEIETKNHIDHFLFRSDANYYRGEECSSGYLYLTSDEIIYVSYSLEENYKIVISLNDIKEIHPVEKPIRFNYEILIRDHLKEHKLLVVKRKLLLNHLIKLGKEIK